MTAHGDPPSAGSVYWPLGTQGHAVIVVLGEEDANQLAPVVLDESVDPDPARRTVVASIPRIRFAPWRAVAERTVAEQLVWEIRAAGLEVVWLVFPASDDARGFGDKVSELLVEAGLSVPTRPSCPAAGSYRNCSRC